MVGIQCPNMDYFLFNENVVKMLRFIIQIE